MFSPSSLFGLARGLFQNRKLRQDGPFTVNLLVLSSFQGLAFVASVLQFLDCLELL